MSMKMRIYLFIFVMLLLAALIQLVKKNKLNLKYSLIWFSCLVLALIVIIFPVTLLWAKQIIGFELPSNLVFVGVICILVVITMSLTVIASTQATRSRLLLQEVSLLKDRVERLEHEQK